MSIKCTDPLRNSELNSDQKPNFLFKYYISDANVILNVEEEWYSRGIKYS